MITLTIGRDVATGKLSVNIQDKVVGYVGESTSVPATVSRGHCQLQINDLDDMTLINMKEMNITKVDGICISRKAITLKSKITLGYDDYKVDMEKLAAIVDKLFPKTYDISPLVSIYAKKEAEMERLAKEVERNNLIKTASSLVASVGMMVALGLGPEGLSIRAYITVPIVIISLILAIRSYLHPVRKKTKEIDSRFRKEYICPNPLCRHSFFGYGIEQLKEKGGCPFCGAKWEKTD